MLRPRDAATGLRAGAAPGILQYPHLIESLFEGYMDTDYVIRRRRRQCNVIFDFYFQRCERSRLAL